MKVNECKVKESMDRVIRLFILKVRKCQSRLLGWLFGIVLISCSGAVVADTLTETEGIAWVDFYTEAMAKVEMTDIDLSVVNGKGWEAIKLNGSEALAVILWDERGSGSRRAASHDAGSSQSFHSVTLTVNQK